MAEQFIHMKNGDYNVLFVNTLVVPNKEIPLNIFRYSEDDGKINFYRLYRVYYMQEGLIEHSMLDWRPISVKRHCQAALKQMIDSFESVIEFLY